MATQADPWAEFRNPAPGGPASVRPGRPNLPPPVRPVQQDIDEERLRGERLENERRQREQDAGIAAQAAEAERKAAAFFIRALGSNRSYEGTGVGPRSYVGETLHDWAPSLLNQLPSGVGNSPERQVADSAQDEFIAASLRQDSGAAIPEEELERQRRIYFPQPGDGPEVIAQKGAARRRALEGLINSAGRALRPEDLEAYQQWAANAEGDVSAPVDQALATVRQVAGAATPGQESPVDPRRAPPGYELRLGDERRPETAWTEDQLRQMQEYVARPGATAEGLNAIMRSSGYEVANAQEIIDEYRRSGRISNTQAPIPPPDISDMRQGSELRSSAPLERTDAAVRSMANTWTLGLADRVAAAGDTVFTGGSYEDNLRRQHAITNYDFNHYPAETYGASLAAGSRLPFPSTLPRQMVAGGGYGSVYAFNATDGSYGERTQNAILGGALGAAAPPILQGAFSVPRAVRETAARAFDRFGPHRSVAAERAFAGNIVHDTPAIQVGQPSPNAVRTEPGYVYRSTRAGGHELPDIASTGHVLPRAENARYGGQKYWVRGGEQFFEPTGGRDVIRVPADRIRAGRPVSANDLERAGPSGEWLPMGDRAASAATARAAREEGIQISRPIVDPSRRDRMAYLESSPGSAGPIRSGLERTRGSIEARTATLGAGGVAEEAGTMGQRIQDAGRRYIDRSRTVGQRAYDRAAALAGSNTAEGREAVRVLDDHIAQLSGNANSNRPLINYMNEIRSDFVDEAGNLVPKGIEAIRDLRTSLRGQINSRNLTATDAERRIGEVLDAAGMDISRDLGRTAPQAVRQYARADRIWRERQNEIGQVIQRVIGRRNDNLSGEQVMARVTAMAGQRGDSARLARLWSRLEPQERLDAAATIVSQVGRRSEDGAFSPARFVQWADTLSPAARRTIFGPEGARSIANLRRVAEAYTATAGRLNNSRSGVMQNWGRAFSFLSGGGTLGTLIGGVPGGATGAAVGATLAATEAGFRNLSARALMSPNMSKWLADGAGLRTEGAVRRHIRLLETVARRDPVIAQEALELQDYLNDALGANGGDSTTRRQE